MVLDKPAEKPGRNLIFTKIKVNKIQKAIKLAEGDKQKFQPVAGVVKRRIIRASI